MWPQCWLSLTVNPEIPTWHRIGPVADREVCGLFWAKREGF
jgi:hypothetical protein